MKKKVTVEFEIDTEINDEVISKHAGKAIKGLDDAISKVEVRVTKLTSDNTQPTTNK